MQCNARSCLIIVSCVWFIAIFRLFFQEEDNLISNRVNQSSSGGRDARNSVAGSEMKWEPLYETDVLNMGNNHGDDYMETVDKASFADIPEAADWMFIREPLFHHQYYQKRVSTKKEKPKIYKLRYKQPKLDETPNYKELKWPPVLRNGSISTIDRYDLMPITGLKVPKFWAPPPGQDLNKIGSFINGQETIFFMVASYRDFQCKETLTFAFDRADHPERLFVGIIDQLIPGDKLGCLDLDIPCSVQSNQTLCRHLDQISIFNMDARKATGPITARHIGDRMYRGQYFIMQMDAHCTFVRHWDSKIVGQWKSTKNEMAVLSTYLSDVQGAITPDGKSLKTMRPIMCNSNFEGSLPAKYLRHGTQPEDYPIIKNTPQLQPFWAAGFSFHRGHFNIRVPYDPYQPMVFQGEEIEIGIRGFTHGYDFYTPNESVVFHEYAIKSKRRKKIPMFWENGNMKWYGKSLKRGTSIIKMANDVNPNNWDHSENIRYGLGNERKVDLFYQLFLIDTKNRKTVDLCPFVKTGLMHKYFVPKLRKNGLGIDYTKLEDFNTFDVIEKQLIRQHPYWSKTCNSAIQTLALETLKYCIDNIPRIHLDKKEPMLLGRVKEALKDIEGKSKNTKSTKA